MNLQCFMSRLKSVTIKFVSYIISALNDIYVFWAAEICDFFQRHFPARRRSLWIPAEPHYPAPFVSLFYEAHCAASIMGLTPASACPALCPPPCVSSSAPTRPPLAPEPSRSIPPTSRAAGLLSNAAHVLDLGVGPSGSTEPPLVGGWRPCAPLYILVVEGVSEAK